MMTMVLFIHKYRNMYLLVFLTCLQNFLLLSPSVIGYSGKEGKENTEVEVDESKFINLE